LFYFEKSSEPKKLSIFEPKHGIGVGTLQELGKLFLFDWHFHTYNLQLHL